MGEGRRKNARGKRGGGGFTSVTPLQAREHVGEKAEEERAGGGGGGVKVVTPLQAPEHCESISPRDLSPA